MFWLMTACSYPYKTLRTTRADTTCAVKFRPAFQSDLYKARVQVMGRNLGGLLLIKRMEDSTARIVFSTETGVKFFDFAFGGTEGFKVHYIMSKLDKKVVINALRYDFDLLLMNDLQHPKGTFTHPDGSIYHAYAQNEKFAYYVTDSACSSLKRMELGSSKKPLAEARLFAGREAAPDSIYLEHHNFNFTIALKKLER